MALDVSEDEKHRHPYYQIMELKGEDLSKFLKSWTREELIDWLLWNDMTSPRYMEQSKIEKFACFDCFQ